VNKAGIIFLALFFCFQFSIESFPQNFFGSELAGQPIHNSKTITLVADTEFRNDDEFGFVLAVYPLRASMINFTTTDVINELDVGILDY
jgi:hypothetical protein